MSELPPPPPGNYPPPPPGGAPGYVVAKAPENGLGTAALVMGILQFLCLGLIGSILAIIFGKIGMNKADRGEATNRGVAKAGFILGIIGAVLTVIGTAIVVYVVTQTPSALCRIPAQAAGTNLTLSGCELPGEDFSNRTLTSWNISNTNLSNTNFQGTTITASMFRNSNLSGATFAGCSLSGVEFPGSNLAGTDFSGCDFRGVDVAGAQYDASTSWPEGFTP